MKGFLSVVESSVAKDFFCFDLQAAFNYPSEIYTASVYWMDGHVYFEASRTFLCMKIEWRCQSLECCDAFKIEGWKISEGKSVDSKLTLWTTHSPTSNIKYYMISQQLHTTSQPEQELQKVNLHA